MSSNFPVNFRFGQDIKWPVGLAMPEQDDSQLRFRLDTFWDDFQKRPADGDSQPAVRCLSAFTSALNRERDFRATLRTLLLVNAPLHDHPAIIQSRLRSYAQLNAIPELEAEFRRVAQLLNGKEDILGRLAVMADQTGLGWRLSDVFQSAWRPELLNGETHLEWLHRNGASGNSNNRIGVMRTQMLTSLGLPPTTRSFKRFERPDRIIDGYRILQKSAKNSEFWPDDETGQTIKAFHQELLDKVVEVDFSLLLEAKAKSLSLILLFSHVGPTTGLNTFRSLGLPRTFIANSAVNGKEVDIFSTIGTPAELAMRFLSLARKMGREQIALIVFPDGGAGGSRVAAEVKGLPIEIGLGAAALARRRPSQLFYARSCIKEKSIVWQFDAGPLLGPEIEQAQADKFFAGFYADCLEKHLRYPVSEIGTPRFQLAPTPTGKQ